MRVTLKRAAESIEGTFGIMSVAGIPMCVTCEDPWIDNKTNISCIPEGVYKCVPHNGAKYKDVWRLEYVPGRSAILIHAGNTEDDTHGCILVGLTLGELNGKPAILNSRKALDFLRAILPDEFMLEVTS